MYKNIHLLFIISSICLLFADPPDWTDNPGAYEFTATISGGIVQNEGVQMGEESDIFAAFDVDGNVRGIALQLSLHLAPIKAHLFLRCRCAVTLKVICSILNIMMHQKMQF